uniref:Prolyl endopeptidase n=2 Tax=Trebouxiophyceae TaxID=75966 RepID=A0A7L9QE92_9CHLO|nr:putative extracellular protein CSOL_049 [Pseudococcomyxa simplex]
MMAWAGVSLLAICCLSFCPGIAGQNSSLPQGAVQSGLVVLPSQYPPVYREDNETADFFGTIVSDPYRWLENTDSNETTAFVAAQNELTNSVLEECDTRSKFKDMMTEMYDFPKISCPYQRGQPGGVLRWYYSSNTGLQSQSVIYTQKTPDSNATVLLDPNSFSADGTVALNDFAFSWDGSLVAYNIASGGSDWETIHVLQINNDTGAVTALNDTLNNVKFSGTAWSPDNKGFFYNQYPAPNITNFDARGTNTGANNDQQLWYHVVGTSQDEDIFVLAIPEEPTYSIGASFTEPKDYLIITVSTGTEPTNKLWYIKVSDLPVSAKTGTLDLSTYDRRKADAKPLPMVKVIDDFTASYGIVASDGPIWTLTTDLDAPRNKLVRVNVTEGISPDTWEVILPEHEKDLMSGSSALKGDALIVTYMRDVATVLQLRSLATGKLIRELPMPGYGSIKDMCGRRSLSEFYYSYQSMTDPGSTFLYDTATPEVDPKHISSVQIPGGYNADGLETTQVFVPSKDGKVKIPMFIVAKKNVTLDGTNPTFLYAYGGYGIVTEPTFSVSRLTYLLAYEGVYAIAGIRGGGEYGNDWWVDGHLLKKQNSFDDFAACAEYLHAAGYSSPGKLTIQGGSNGGLLMGAELTQRPDLFGAVISQVGVYDMLRYQLFTIGHAWMTEYGDPTNKTDFEYMYKYSPLHNVRVPAGSHQYPATLLTTADHDDRVVPLHSYKFIATLQHTLAGYPGSPQRNPLILRVDSKAGHGGGKPTGKVIEEYSDLYGFAAKAMSAKWVLQKPTGTKPVEAAG